MSNELQRQDPAKIAAITDVKEAARVKYLADAADKFYSAQDDWMRAQQAKEISMRSARQAGALLAEVPRKPGERTDLTSRRREGRLKEILDDSGLSETTGRRWQKLAEIPDEQFELYFGEAHYSNWEYTFASLMRWARREEETPVRPKAIEFEGEVREMMRTSDGGRLLYIGPAIRVPGGEEGKRYKATLIPLGG